MKCRQKTRFATVEEAERYGVLYYQRPYKCPNCGFFHLTKNAQVGEPGGREREAEARLKDEAWRKSQDDWKYKRRRMRRAGR